MIRHLFPAGFRPDLGSAEIAAFFSDLGERGGHIAGVLAFRAEPEAGSAPHG
jgi:hypothetical protein